MRTAPVLAMAATLAGCALAPPELVVNDSGHANFNHTQKHRSRPAEAVGPRRMDDTPPRHRPERSLWFDDVVVFVKWAF